MNKYLMTYVNGNVVNQQIVTGCDFAFVCSNHQYSMGTLIKVELYGSSNAPIGE